MACPQNDRRANALGLLVKISDDVLCRILGLLAPRDVGTLACVSSVFYVLCNEEPLWMQLCLERHDGSLSYKGSWRETALEKFQLIKNSNIYERKSRRFEGFSSEFLYRRWYRCHVALDGFALDNGAVERREALPPEEFTRAFDGKKPVLIMNLMNSWPATERWGLDSLAESCGDAHFKVSQPHGKSIDMTMKNYVQYMQVQRDEEPLYIFDAQFGESAPELLEDYKVPEIFSEDFFSVLSNFERPPFRWFVLGPARSGASWHVDPSLTSAWNSLVSGRKRWALYPPGKVPPGVVLDVDEDDGSVHYDGPTSLQWWLDIYPYLEDEYKPLECTQLPGETIYVPSGWWHCVLNIDASVAVTQNFVNHINFEIVCMDLSPGYRHRAIARAGAIALEGRSLENRIEVSVAPEAQPVFALSKGPKVSLTGDCSEKMMSENGKGNKLNLENLTEGGISDASLLLALKDLKIKTHDHIDPAEWHLSEKGNLGGSMLRDWLRKLWITRLNLQPLIWKGACLALDAGIWLRRITSICTSLGLPIPTAEEQLPVGDGSNPVYLVGDNVIKIYIQEGGNDASVEVLGSELEFYALLKETGSSLQGVIPKLVASGILVAEGEDYAVNPWDGTGDVSFSNGNAWQVGKKRYRDISNDSEPRLRTKWAFNSYTLKALNPAKSDSEDEGDEIKVWPYLITKRCPGTSLSKLTHEITDYEYQCLASFLAENVSLLHTLPLPKSVAGGFRSKEAPKKERPPRKSKVSQLRHASQLNSTSTPPAVSTRQFSGWADMPDQILRADLSDWQLFVSYLRMLTATLSERLHEWSTLPEVLLEKINTYLPADPVVLIGDLQSHGEIVQIARSPVWLHNDLMSDNILMERLDNGSLAESELTGTPTTSQDRQNLKPSRIFDFGDLLLGDPLYEFVSIFLNAFNLKKSVMETFLRYYKLRLRTFPHVQGSSIIARQNGDDVQPPRLSYSAMCYTLLHEQDHMSIIFNKRGDLRNATTFEEIEESIWGFLNVYS